MSNLKLGVGVSVERDTTPQSTTTGNDNGQDKTRERSDWTHLDKIEQGKFSINERSSIAKDQQNKVGNYDDDVSLWVLTALFRPNPPEFGHGLVVVD
ncbi:hypothetical protein V492_02055 [Pseudogymnoascus sp. VKM F-4246]|nr:hypothetical protein V492_02055 [Pseudogymnoascus sp. VKM F-4246]